jgi:hypothetical protein
LKKQEEDSNIKLEEAKKMTLDIQKMSEDKLRVEREEADQ